MVEGEGGRATGRIIRDIFLKHFSNPLLDTLADSAVLNFSGGKLAFSTDNFVIDPPEFIGGDIGKLAFCGTVNDLSAVGAKPIALSAGFILEEGLSKDQLEKYVQSMATLSTENDIPIVCGDTKVVPHGKGDGLYINTAGIGIVPDNCNLGVNMIEEGDVLIISGSIGRHAASIIALRENLHADPPMKSDCAPLNNLVQQILQENIAVHCMRDPTRGGLGGIIVELAEQSGYGIEINETDIPIDKDVKALCEIYGYDPLYLPCEGRMLFYVAAKNAEKALELIENLYPEENPSIIGEVKSKSGVFLKTKSGGVRRLIAPEGAPLPRIC